MLRKLVLIGAATVAVASLSGVGYAAIPGSDGTISACKDSKGALKVIDAEAGQTCSANQQHLAWNQQGQPGPQGAPGPAGPQGPAGGARAHAHIGLTGSVWDGNLTSANVVRAGVGRYCFGSLGFDPQTAVVTLGAQSTTPGTPVPIVRILNGDSEGCPVGFWQAKVTLVQPDTNVFDDQEFFVVFN